MSRRREATRQWILGVIERFRQSGAVSPDRAMTPESLGLPPRFKEAMRGRLGSLGIFVGVNGKYYLSEERLKQMRGLAPAEGAAQRPWKTMQTLSIVRMTMIMVFVVLILINIFVQSPEIRVVSSLFLVLWLAVSVVLIYYRLRARKRIPF